MSVWPERVNDRKAAFDKEGVAFRCMSATNLFLNLVNGDGNNFKTLVIAASAYYDSILQRQKLLGDCIADFLMTAGAWCSIF